MNLRFTWLLAALMAPLSVHAAFLHGETLDAAANWLAWLILFLVPVVVIGGFLFVHVLPEKIAEHRQHPHKDSIKVLCILSLFFGGMLWPLAWLWAYTRPIGYRMIYGTEKHDDYFLELAEQLHAGKLPPDQVAQLRAELAAMDARSGLSPALRPLAERLEVVPGADSATVVTPRPPQRVTETAGGGGA